MNGQLLKKLHGTRRSSRRRHDKNPCHAKRKQFLMVFGFHPAKCSWNTDKRQIGRVKDVMTRLALIVGEYAELKVKEPLREAHIINYNSAVQSFDRAFSLVQYFMSPDVSYEVSSWKKLISKTDSSMHARSLAV